MSPKFQNKFDRSVSLLSFAYNEELSIYEFLKKATALMDETVDDYEIVLIDDCSTDRTYEIARKFQQKNPNLKIFRNKRNLNYGLCLQRSIKNATKEFLFWQTVDWSYDISNLRQFLELLKTYDVIQGVREKPVEVKGKVLKPILEILKLFGVEHLAKRSDTIPKAIVSVVNYILIRILFRIPLSDFQNVTFYSTKWIQSIQFESQSSFTAPEGLIKSYWKGMSIKEVPINFVPRDRGGLKVTSIKAILEAVRDIIFLWFKWIVLGKLRSVKKGKIIRLNSRRIYEEFTKTL